MDQSTTQSTSNTKTRDDSIQAAKKKLKTFRAKQAQVAKRSSSSSAAPASASQRNRASLILSQAAAQTVSNAIEQASDLAQSSTANSNSHVRTHSRTASRAGHGRGHSRGGSISITAQGMANLVNSSLNQTTNPTSNTNQQPSSRNSMRNSGIFSIPSSTSMPAVTSTTSNRTSFIASTPASTHVRSHSRTGSRSTLGRSRPASLIGLGAINHGEGVTLAVELPPDASLLGGMGRSEDWKDINNGNDGTKRNSNRLSDASSSRKSWNSISNNNNNNRLSAPSSRRTSERPISGSSATSNKSTTSSNGTATGNSPNPTSSSSLASPNRLSFNFIDRNNLNSSPQPPSTSLSSNPRRQSRHGRQASVSTKRESMEIMGGLGYGGDVRNSKRFSSSNNRMSGIQSASILFGGEPDQSGNGGRRDWDMRGLKVNDNEDDGDDRLTALEKLEGRSRSVSPNPPVTSSSEPPRSPSARHQQQDQDQRSSLVQLPSFDDVHGDEAMDKRKSLTLLEKNEQSTSQQSGPASINAIWDDSSNEDLLPSSSRSSGSLSQSHSDPKIKTRPMSMFGDSSPALEGLTTLMEEEEEEEASPIKENSSNSNLSSNDSLLENGESSEDAALKRARRASLTPRPLKLKSRPASLFISPAMRASTSGLGSSNNTSQMSTSSSLQSLPEIAASPRTAKQTKEWSFSRAQQNAVEAKEGGEGSIDDLASPPIPARAFPSISSAPIASNGEMTPPASSTTPTGPRGIKPLRLASSSSAGISSPSASANVDSPTAMNGAFSFPQNASSATSSSHGSQSSIASTTSAGTAKRNSLLQLGSLGRPSLEGREEYNAPSISPVGMGGMRRSSIIYKTSKNNDSTVNTPTSSNANGSHSPFSPNESSTISPSTSTSSNLNNVSSASFEELKAKANRDASLLETSRKQVERLQKELLIETERSCKEYSELERRSAAVYSELERWSAEEKRGLGSRIEALEMDISKSLEKIKELERSKSESEEEMKERLEEFESERESWRDDEEGWRTRCSDAEKSSMKERARVEEEKRKNESLRKRNKALTLALEKAGIEVPQMEEGSGFIGEDLTLDLAAVLRSPALGSGAMRSPALGSAGGFENSSGYFSPRSFNGANGKTSQDFADPPTTVKLLAEMRQQIFNLAGSLEHERKEHLKAREEADNLKVSLESVQQQSSQSEENDSSISSTLDGPLSSNSHDDNLLRRSNSNPRIGSAGSSGNGQRTKKHVFAYDSSMGSFGQSAGSNSIRSQNVSISMSTSTDETGFEDESLNHGKEAALTQEQKIQQQQQPPLSSSSSVASNLTAMPSSSSLNDLNSNDEMVGLGVAMGGLQTLTEEEEAEAVDDDEAGLFDVVNSKPQDDQFEDLESGGLVNDEESIVDERELVDAQEQVRDDDFDLEAGVAGDYQDDEEEDLESNMPPTPALDHDDQYESTPPPSYRSSSNHPDSTNQNHGSSGGSLESNGPASPVREALEEQDEEFYDEEDDEEEEEEDDYPQSSTPPGEPRPEFLREWSFSRATAAVQASRSTKRRSSSQKKSKKVKKFGGKKNVKNVDIEDFFGILCDHSLPPLPPPPEALEMPPVYIEPQQQQSLSNFPFGMIGSNQSYDKAPRASMRVATTINPNPLLASNGVGARRPPVARSAYVRESFESHQNESVSSNNSHQMNSSPHGSSASSNSNNSSGSLSGMGIGNSMAMATTAAGLGSKALSRMSLQGLTSAFSGLGGYLTSQSGAAVNVAANATRMCNGNGELSPVHGLNENGGYSTSWIEAKRRESSDEDDEDALHPAVRKALEKNPNNNNNQFGSVSSNQSSNSSSVQPKFQRRFLIKDQVRKPIATPVWQLDFETATLGRGAGPLIQL